MSHHPSASFITRWKSSGASERANYQLFLSELCELLQVEKPRPASDKVHEADYTFERPVAFNDGEGKITTNFIDLYKRHCFVLEAKQGSDKAMVTEAELLGAERIKTKLGTATRDTRTWDREMKNAKEQALRYARSLPASEGWPPFLVVVDVGYCIDLYSDFARQGKTYIPFPDPLNYRIPLADLEKVEVQEKLRLLFTNPLELDPGKRAAKVTRELAERLAKLAALFEQSGHSPEKVAGFLMRCLFTMFAEDVKLLPELSFTKLLQDYKNNLAILPEALQSLWASMDKGGFDPALRTIIPQFNGFLFKDQEALPLSAAQLDLLILASEADWANVEPAIFGTLLERALDPRERHKLGAHFTPRAYVERLVMPTVIEPLREEWEAARTASAILEADHNDDGALKEIEKFHRRLCTVKVLDPASGIGNFLYVTLEHLKRLEGEVMEYISRFPRQLGLDMTGGYTVTPAQLLGLEINPRAAAIADVVLWIGYLQWHFKTHGHAKRLENPILRQYGNIVQQDAVLSYTEKKPRLDANGEPITRWDGHSTKTHPVTGLEVPDETARTPVYDYVDPKPATWPHADFVVGNPPFIGDKAMRAALGDGYVDALRKAYKGIVPESADFVMFWWNKAAEIVRKGSNIRFGLITTNSIKQTFNRRVLQAHIENEKPLSITYCIPDHPWVDSAEGASVRIAMTVGEAGFKQGRLLTVIDEKRIENEFEVAVLLKEKIGIIHADLKVGVNVTGTSILKANDTLACPGVQLSGQGFIVDLPKAKSLGLGNEPGLEKIIRKYINGRDLLGQSRNLMVIDLFEQDINILISNFPQVYQHVYDNVKAERVGKKGGSKDVDQYAEKWWLFAKTRPSLRSALLNQGKYIATCRTAKYRTFTLIDSEILADAKIVVITLEDPYYLGVLSSKFHTEWAMKSGGWLGVGNDSTYNHSECFYKFPFPNCSEEDKAKIRRLAISLDSHRKQRQAIHLTLNITDMYNVLEKLRSGETLNAKDQKIHEQGLVSILLQLHNELDAAVAAAYGWPANLTEAAILENLVALNKERAAEEANGLIRWLRPEYQNPQGTQQTGMNMITPETAKPTTELPEWPKTLAEQAQAVQRMLQQFNHPISASDINRKFVEAKKAANASREQQIGHLLETICTLGLLRKTEDGGYVR